MVHDVSIVIVYNVSISKHIREKTDCTDQGVMKPTNQVSPSSGFGVPSLCSKTKGHMGVGTGGAGGAIAPPIFCQPKNFKSLKITTHKSVYSNKDKIGF